MSRKKPEQAAIALANRMARTALGADEEQDGIPGGASRLNKIGGHNLHREGKCVAPEARLSCPARGAPIMSRQRRAYHIAPEARPALGGTPSA